jgi:hypothetical protein
MGINNSQYEYIPYGVQKQTTKRPLSRSLRKEVWKTYHGRTPHGECYCCGIKISESKWHCSHVLARSKQGSDEVSNLRTCCVTCNTTMGNQNLYTFIKDNINSRQLHGPGTRKYRNYLTINPQYTTDIRTNIQDDTEEQNTFLQLMCISFVGCVGLKFLQCLH